MNSVLRQINEQHKQRRARLGTPPPDSPKIFRTVDTPVVMQDIDPKTTAIIEVEQKAPEQAQVICLSTILGRITLAEAFRAVCEHFKISAIDLMSMRRTKDIVVARQMFFAVARELTAHSYPAMGRFARRDHTTVLYADRKIRAMMETDALLREHFEVICAALRAKLPNNIIEELADVEG